MKEFFDRPPDGPFGFSRAYVERMQGVIERASRSPGPLSSAGMSVSDASGWWIDFHPEGLLFAEITAQPTGGYLGYSWREREPDHDGGWKVPETMRSGDNGSQAGTAILTVTNAGVTDGVATITTDGAHGFAGGDAVTIDGAGDPFDGDWRVASVTAPNAFTFALDSDDVPPAGAGGTATRAGLFAFQPAFDLNGDQGIATGTVVVLMRGYKHVGGVDAANTGDSLGLGYVPGQEFVILGGAGSGGGVRRLRVTGRPYCVGGRKYYPAVLDRMKAAPAPDDFEDGAAVWLRHRLDADLGTTGVFFALATRERANFAVPTGMGTTESRPLYVTEKRLYVTKVTCDPVTRAPLPWYEDTYEGCLGVPELDFSVAGNSMYVPLLFNPGAAVGGF